jgi:hypothetical protein
MERRASHPAFPDHTGSRFFRCPPLYARHSRRSPSRPPDATRPQRIVRARIDSVPDGERRRLDWMPRGRHRTEDSHQTIGATNGTLSHDRDSISCSSRTTSARDVKGMSRDHRGSPRAHRSQNPVEYRVQFRGHVLGEITQHEIAVLLQ